MSLSFSIQAADGGPADRWGPSYQSSVNSSYWWGYRVFWRATRHQHNNTCGHRVQPPTDRPDRPTVAQVPELNAAGAGLSLALLGLFIGLMREGRRGKQ